MEIEILNNYHTDENTYLLHENGVGVVIDPGYNAEEIVKSASALKVTITHVMITHCHYDHIEFLEELRALTGAKLISGDKGSINVTDPDINLTLAGLGRAVSAKKSDIVLGDGEEITIGTMKIKCIYTPGHTNCGVCYLVEDKIFVGDTLFLRNCGRWDLPTGDEETLIKSVREKLYTLDDNIKVCPGHGRETTIGYEKKFNFYIKG